MKNAKFKLTILLLPFILSACVGSNVDSSGSSSSDPSTSSSSSESDSSSSKTSESSETSGSEGSSSDSHSSESTSESSEKSSASETSSSDISSSESTSESSSEDSSSESSEESSSSSSTYIGEDRTVTLYAINDFHGQLEPDGSEAGIVRLGGFMKAKGQEENTLILCTGDLWQGSLESNYNRGKLLTDVMNEAQFDCFTFGNHEFDWGADYIRENRLRADPETGYSTPFVSANIYNYDIDTNTTLEFSELGDKYVIHELENGLKVGIVGGIGYDQITSITSTFADEFTFVNPTSHYDLSGNKAKSIYEQMSDELRSLGCDVVILDHHGGQGELVNKGLTDISDVSGKRYYDGIFCGHTHSKQKTRENGVPFVQGSCNGQAYSTITLSVAGDGSGDVTCLNYDNPYSSTIDASYDDQAIQDIVDAYAVETDALGSEVLTTFEGNWSQYGEIPNLVCESIAKVCETENIDIDIAIVNQGRAALSEGDITYSDLFTSVPFDNEIYIIEASGTDIISRASGNYMYRIKEEAFSSSGTYTAAVIEYLAVHRNSNREYDYFPTANWDTASILTQNGERVRYREITADNLRSANSFSNEDYAGSLSRYNTSLLTSNVTF